MLHLPELPLLEAILLLQFHQLVYLKQQQVHLTETVISLQKHKLRLMFYLQHPYHFRFPSMHLERHMLDHIAEFLSVHMGM